MVRSRNRIFAEIVTNDVVGRIVSASYSAQIRDAAVRNNLLPIIEIAAPERGFELPGGDTETIGVHPMITYWPNIRPEGYYGIVPIENAEQQGLVF